jgi:hypothetical protein
MTDINPINNIWYLTAGECVAVILVVLAMSGCATRPAGPKPISADERVSIQRDVQRLFAPHLQSAAADDAGLAGSASAGHEDSAEGGAQ